MNGRKSHMQNTATATANTATATANTATATLEYSE